MTKSCVFHILHIVSFLRQTAGPLAVTTESASIEVFGQRTLLFTGRWSAAAERCHLLVETSNLCFIICPCSLIRHHFLPPSSEAFLSTFHRQRVFNSSSIDDSFDLISSNAKYKLPVKPLNDVVVVSPLLFTFRTCFIKAGNFATAYNLGEDHSCVVTDLKLLPRSIHRVFYKTGESDRPVPFKWPNDSSSFISFLRHPTTDRQN